MTPLEKRIEPLLAGLSDDPRWLPYSVPYAPRHMSFKRRPMAGWPRRREQWQGGVDGGGPRWGAYSA